MAYTGYPFADANPLTRLNVWNKALTIEGYDPAIYRKDICGNWIQFDEHGLETDYGWEIDHILPRALGGMTYLANLQPLWWRNNRLKGDTYPWRI